MTRKDLKNAIDQLSPYQINVLSQHAAKYLDLNERLQNTRPAVCPKCSAENTLLIKKGFSRGKQRYQCKCCGKKFTYDTMQITSHSHQPVESWIVVMEDTLALEPLKNTELRIGVSHETAFHMRHKLLAYLEQLVRPAASLSALIEADETFVAESQKGIPVTHRKPRLHGEGVNHRGLSHEQLCVCVATDRNHHVAATCVNRAKPSGQDLELALAEHILSGSVILCDKAQAYNRLATNTNCKKVALEGHESYDRVYHLNTVNHLHSKLKEMLRKYRGVSTKCLNRYLALFTLLSQYCGLVVSEIADDIRACLAGLRFYATIKSVKTLGLLAL